jgi:hypothetical protein
LHRSLLSTTSVPRVPRATIAGGKTGASGRGADERQRFRHAAHAQAQGNRDTGEIVMRRGARARGIDAEFAVQGDKLGISRAVDLLLQASEQVRAPFAKIVDTRRQTLGMQAEPQNILPAAVLTRLLRNNPPLVDRLQVPGSPGIERPW